MIEIYLAFLLLLALVYAFLLLFTLIYIGAIFYLLQKALNEIIKGMTSMDARLVHIEETLPSRKGSGS